MQQETVFTGLIIIHGKPAEVRFEQLEKLTTINAATLPRRHYRDMTLVYKHHICPDEYLSPIVALPGKHFEYADPLYLQGLRKGSWYVLETLLLSESDKEADWMAKGIRDQRGRVWFVDP
jgi:hypothetical protein